MALVYRSKVHWIYTAGLNGYFNSQFSNYRGFLYFLSFQVTYKVGQIVKCIDGDKASGVIVGWDENIEDLTEKNNALSSEIQKTVREKEKSKVKLHAISNGHYLNNRLLFD